MASRRRINATITAAAGVQQDAHQVIAEHGVAPQFVFDPESAVQQRVVLLGAPN